MIIRATSLLQGYLDISGPEELGQIVRTQLRRTIVAGQTLEIPDEYYEFPNIIGAINAGLLEILSFDSRPWSRVVNAELSGISGASGTGKITVISGLPGDPNEVVVNDVDTIRFIQDTAPGEQHFAVDAGNNEVYLGGPQVPGLLENKDLAGMPSFLVGRLSDSNINYKMSEPAGSSVTYIVRTTSLTLTTPSTCFSKSSLGNLILDVNGADVANVDLGANFVEANRTSGQDILGYDIQGTGDPIIDGIVSFIGGSLKIVSVAPDGNLFSDAYQRGVAQIILNTTAMQQGYNRITLRHVISPDVFYANTIEFFLDTNSSGATFDPKIGSNPNVKQDIIIPNFISGIRYYGTGSIFLLDFSLENGFDNVYHNSEAPVVVGNFPGLNTNIRYDHGSVSGVSIPPDIGETMVVTDYPITIPAGVQSFNPVVNLTPRDPYGNYAIASSVGSNFMIMSVSPSSTTTEEFFLDENYRFPATTNFDIVPANLTGNWDSSLYLGATDLQVFAPQQMVKNILHFPQTDYSTGFLPQPNPDYTGLSGGINLVYYRVYQGDKDNSNGLLSVPGITDDDLLSGNIKIDIKVPTRTVWLSLNDHFVQGTFFVGANLSGGTDGEGARINETVHSPNLDGTIEFSLGMYASDSSANRLLFVRVTYKDSAIPRTIAGSGDGFSLLNW